jgi:hypothetical protein
MPSAPGDRRSIDVFDVRGRWLARLERQDTDHWVWEPDAGTPPGLYVFRSGDLSTKALRMR